MRFGQEFGQEFKAEHSEDAMAKRSSAGGVSNLRTQRARRFTGVVRSTRHPDRQSDFDRIIIIAVNVLERPKNSLPPTRQASKNFQTELGVERIAAITRFRRRAFDFRVEAERGVPVRRPREVIGFFKGLSKSCDSADEENARKRTTAVAKCFRKAHLPLTFEVTSIRTRS